MNSTLNAVFPPGSEGLCFPFYGEFSKAQAKDCLKALNLMDSSKAEETYNVNRGEGPFHLPLYRQSGSCLIQVEMAGRNVPLTIELAPSEIRDLAEIVFEQCVQGLHGDSGKVGGFVTNDITPLKNYVQEEGFDFDKPYPSSTAFLAVSISHRVPDWLAPGNFDPLMSFVLADAELNAAGKVASKSAQAKELVNRSRKFYDQGRRMEPRGQRIPWYDIRMFGSSGSTASNNLTTSSVLSTNSSSTTSDTATARRRRRNL